MSLAFNINRKSKYPGYVISRLYLRAINKALFYVIQQVKSLILEFDLSNNVDGPPDSGRVHNNDVRFDYASRFERCDFSIDALSAR